MVYYVESAEQALDVLFGGEGKVKSGNSLCYTSINFQNMVVRERGHSS